MLEELAGIGPCMFRAPIAFARKKLFSKIENKKKGVVRWLKDSFERKHRIFLPESEIENRHSPIFIILSARIIFLFPILFLNRAYSRQDQGSFIIPIKKNRFIIRLVLYMQICVKY